MMKTITKPFSFELNYDLSKYGNLEGILFFDIETTGFTPSNSSLYLIGCVYYKEQSWWLTQWFANGLSDEPYLLKAFFQFLHNYHTLIHFNGDTFDIPYITKCAHQYSILNTFSLVNSIDIYKLIKPLKKSFQLESLKLKSIETFLGIQREDTFTGGELIQVYHEYTKSKDPTLLNLLLLHNEDDLKGMPNILPILYYVDLLDSPIHFQNSICNDEILECYFSCNISIPSPLHLQTKLGKLEMNGNTIKITIPIIYGNFKYFYPNYKDYYYLPLEDTAIHKKVAQFVDKENKKKATASTCYSRHNGYFLPISWDSSLPLLKTDYKSKDHFVLFENTDNFFKEYTTHILFRNLL